MTRQASWHQKPDPERIRASPYRIQLGAEEEVVQVDALEADIVVHGPHAEPGLLQDVILANLQQVPMWRDAAHRGRQLVVRQRVQRQVDTTALGLQGSSEYVSNVVVIIRSTTPCYIMLTIYL